MEGFYRQKHKENLYSFVDGPKHKENPFSFLVSIFRRGTYFPPGYLFSAGVPILWHNRGGRVRAGRESVFVFRQKTWFLT